MSHVFRLPIHSDTNSPSSQAPNLGDLASHSSQTLVSPVEATPLVPRDTIHQIELPKIAIEAVAMFPEFRQDEEVVKDAQNENSHSDDNATIKNQPNSNIRNNISSSTPQSAALNDANAGGGEQSENGEDVVSEANDEEATAGETAVLLNFLRRLTRSQNEQKSSEMLAEQYLMLLCYKPPVVNRTSLDVDGNSLNIDGTSPNVNGKSQTVENLAGKFKKVFPLIEQYDKFSIVERIKMLWITRTPCSEKFIENLRNRSGWESQIEKFLELNEEGTQMLSHSPSGVPSETSVNPIASSPAPNKIMGTACKAAPSMTTDSKRARPSSSTSTNKPKRAKTQNMNPQESPPPNPLLVPPNVHSLRHQATNSAVFAPTSIQTFALSAEDNIYVANDPFHQMRMSKTTIEPVATFSGLRSEEEVRSPSNIPSPLKRKNTSAAGNKPKRAKHRNKQTEEVRNPIPAPSNNNQLSVAPPTAGLASPLTSLLHQYNSTYRMPSIYVHPRNCITKTISNRSDEVIAQLQRDIVSWYPRDYKSRFIFRNIWTPENCTFTGLMEKWAQTVVDLLKVTTNNVADMDIMEYTVTQIVSALWNKALLEGPEFKKLWDGFPHKSAIAELIREAITLAVNKFVSAEEFEESNVSVLSENFHSVGDTKIVVCRPITTTGSQCC